MTPAIRFVMLLEDTERRGGQRAATNQLPNGRVKFEGLQGRESDLAGESCFLAGTIRARLAHVEFYQHTRVEVDVHGNVQPRLSTTRSDAGLPFRGLPPVRVRERAARSGQGSGFPSCGAGARLATAR